MGKPNRTHHLSIAAAVALAFVVTLVAACGGESSPKPPPSPTPTVTPTSTPVPPPPPIPASTPGNTDPSFFAPPEALVFERGVIDSPALDLFRPSSLAFGPDGRLYIAELDGGIVAVTLDGMRVIDIEQIALPDVFGDVLGIAFNPTDPPSPVTLYVSHTRLFTLEGGPLFPGGVAKLAGPRFRPVDIITGLPVGAREHGTNSITFDAEGRLFIGQASTTNAGLKSERHPRPETPLSAAILVAELQLPDFDGAVQYEETEDGFFDQVAGDVHVYASGLRNPFDLVIHSNGHIYATENGPNPDSGSAALDCVNGGDGPWGPDELNLIVRGQYYGHANPNRGRFDAAQCAYHAADDGSPGVTPPIATLGYSVSANGIVEYTANAFGGALRGDLLYVEWNYNRLMRVRLSPDGTRVESISQLVPEKLNSPLDIAIDSDGTIYIAEYESGDIVIYTPAE